MHNPFENLVTLDGYLLTFNAHTGRFSLFNFGELILSSSLHGALGELLALVPDAKWVKEKDFINELKAKAVANETALLA